MLQSRGEKQEWLISGQIGYIAPTAGGVPNASKQGTKTTLAHKWADWLHNPHCLGGPQCFRAGTKAAVAYKWANWLLFLV